MRTIKEIIKRKQKSKDCTEFESARLKDLIKTICKTFPMEYQEANEEMEREN